MNAGEVEENFWYTMWHFCHTGMSYFMMVPFKHKLIQFPLDQFPKCIAYCIAVKIKKTVCTLSFTLNALIHVRWVMRDEVAFSHHFLLCK